MLVIVFVIELARKSALPAVLSAALLPVLVGLLPVPVSESY